MLANGCADQDSLTPPTPPLLEGVSGPGGWWNGGCPPGNAAEAQLFPSSEEALSPELMERLGRQFPAGSDANRLERALRDQGFTLVAACNGHPSIRRAEFR